MANKPTDKKSAKKSMRKVARVGALAAAIATGAPGEALDSAIGAFSPDNGKQTVMVLDAGSPLLKAAASTFGISKASARGVGGGVEVAAVQGCSVVTCPEIVKEAIKTSTKLGSSYALVGAFMCIMDVALGDKLPTQGILSEMRTVCYHLGEFSKKMAVETIGYEFRAHCRNGEWRIFATPSIEMDIPREVGMPEKQGIRFLYKLDGLAADGSAQYVNAKIVGDGDNGRVKVQIELGDPEAITASFTDEASAIRYLQRTQDALAPFNAIYKNLETHAIGDDHVIARVPVKAFTDNGANFQVARDWRARLGDSMVAISDKLREKLLPILKADGRAPTKRVTLQRSPAGM